MELVDTSVWARQTEPRIAGWWRQMMLAGEIATCDQVKLELLHSARNGGDFAARRSSLDALPCVPLKEELWRRAIDLYQELAAVRPQWHRSVKHADLLIAVCAESAGLTLVHCDADYDAIARVSGQPTRWALPKGS